VEERVAFSIDVYSSAEINFCSNIALQLWITLVLRCGGFFYLKKKENRTLTPCLSFHILHAVTGGWWLTCSATRFVVPASSSHFPMKSSPRKGFNGFIFFLFPLSSLLLCCCLSVLKNHFKTNRALFSGLGSLAGATKRLGCSAQ
jgi:hypothetical protein